MSIEKLYTTWVRTDGGTQPRAVLNDPAIEEYREAMESGERFPPIRVVYDGRHYWLFDGFHRLEACKRADIDEIEAEVLQGTVEEARWCSYASNGQHGLRRTNADKRRAVEAALRHPHGMTLSDRAIAAHVGVSDKTVAAIRRTDVTTGAELPHVTDTGDNGYHLPEPAPPAPVAAVQREVRVGLDGKSYPARVERTPKPTWPEADEHGAYAVAAVKADDILKRQRGEDHVILRALQVGTSDWTAGATVMAGDAALFIPLLAGNVCGDRAEALAGVAHQVSLFCREAKSDKSLTLSPVERRNLELFDLWCRDWSGEQVDEDPVPAGKAPAKRPVLVKGRKQQIQNIKAAILLLADEQELWLRLGLELQDDYELENATVKAIRHLQAFAKGLKEKPRASSLAEK